jgi:hypothetical protein
VLHLLDRAHGIGRKADRSAADRRGARAGRTGEADSSRHQHR